MQKKSSDRPLSCAGVFHSLAESFLDAQGFALSGDLASGGMFAASAARYRSKRGLWLWVTFDPNDSMSAGISCGREWAPRGAAAFLSNRYSKLAQRLGVDVPAFYPMDRSEPLNTFMERILADLKRSLPIVVANASLNDLIAVENEEPSGAAVNVMRTYGTNYAAAVDISEFLAD